MLPKALDAGNLITLTTIYTHFMDVYLELDYATQLRLALHLQRNSDVMHVGLYQAINQPCQCVKNRSTLSSLLEFDIISKTMIC